MAQIIGYIATSLDGFIADQDNGIDWLTAFDGMDLREHDNAVFLEGIDTVVMGRATYDFLAALDMPWPYAGKRSIVVTSRPLPEPCAPLETRSDIDALIGELRGLPGDVWMLGGGRLQMAFLERGALDAIEIYVMPVLIGGGRPLFPPTGLSANARLVSVKALDRGCVRLHYAFA
ncbi:dihydrofolate reductase family protein [Martelella sp. AD-3]|uniref:dihydrofolate reductase family protein n=1 Tax=Martelella sp. AD-3 TaxID=686597 RepID=UPI000464D087|nr:dihydrofolate reductase family protein [Martelella sp. AD-3]AMM87002.1 dihydrofolate reductase [Martelella sp. AD-3]